jgi:hypothetical protein
LIEFYTLLTVSLSLSLSLLDLPPYSSFIANMKLLVIVVLMESIVGIAQGQSSYTSVRGMPKEQSSRDLGKKDKKGGTCGGDIVEVLKCGMTFDDQYENALLILPDDLDCPGVNGITISAPGIVLDCKGNKFTGTGIGSFVGLNITNFGDNVIVKNCIFQEFGDNGIESRSSNVFFSNVKSSKNGNSGLFIFQGRATVVGSTFVDNVYAGVYVSVVADSLFTSDSTISKNGQYGLENFVSTTLENVVLKENGINNIVNRLGSNLRLSQVTACDAGNVDISNGGVIVHQNRSNTCNGTFLDGSMQVSCDCTC